MFEIGKKAWLAQGLGPAEMVTIVGEQLHPITGREYQVKDINEKSVNGGKFVKQSKFFICQKQLLSAGFGWHSQSLAGAFLQGASPIELSGAISSVSKQSNRIYIFRLPSLELHRLSNVLCLGRPVIQGVYAPTEDQVA